MWKLLTICVFFANAFAVSNDTCVVQPQLEMCQNYELPDEEVESNIDLLCTSMPEMPGCTVDNICKSSKYSNDIYCVPFSVYKDLCLDMPMMNGCQDYKSMCNVSSVVLECSTPALPLPSTMDIEDLITSMCNQMPMEGCNECTSSLSDCDLLTTYSDLCMSMPSMSECTDWKTYCELIPDWPICSASAAGNADPIMRMYFHTGFEDYVLFKDWVPRNRAQYVGTWFAVCLAGIVFEALRWCRHLCEVEWKKYSHIDKNKWVPFDWRVDVPRAAMRFVEVVLSYSLMLVAMTFNVGLFFAVAVGFSVGTLLFGRFIAWEKQQEAADCCG